MATDSRALRRMRRQLARSLRRQSLTVAAGISLLVMLAPGCAGEPELQPQQFVGTWQSSRLASRPLQLLANGDWEIRSEGAAKPLQYGVWQLQGRTILWTFRSNSETVHDKNRIESFDSGRFVLREQDGSLTSFARLN